MTRTHWILAGALGLQVVLAAVLWSSRGDGASDAEPVLDLEAAEVVALEIEGPGDEEPLRFERKEDDWRLASHADYPMRDEAAAELVDKLVEMKARQPIATRAENHASLRVSDERFDRRVTVETSEGEEHQLLLGRGASGTVNLRKDRSEEVIQARGLTIGDVPFGMSSWVDTSVFEFSSNAAQQMTIQRGGTSLTLRKQDKAWELLEKPAGRKVDDDSVDALVRSVASLSFVEPVGQKAADEYGLGDAARVSIAYEKAGKTSQIVLKVGAEDGDKRYVQAGDDWVLLVRSSALTKLLETGVEDLLTEPSTAEAPGAPPSGLPN